MQSKTMTERTLMSCLRLRIEIRKCGPFLATALLALLAPLHGQTPSRIEVTASADHLTIGDRITLRLAADHGADVTVAWPDSLPGITPFEQMTAPTVSSSELENGMVRSTAEYVVAAFELGEFTFPPLTFDVVQASGDTARVASDSLTITIATVGLEGSEDIRGIKPPVDIPLSRTVVAAWLFVAMAALGIAWFVYRRLRQRPITDVRAAKAIAPRPPHVVAYEALDRLERSSLLEDGEIKRWYSEITKIIRVYIEGRYAVTAMEMSTSDILRALERDRLDFRALDQFRDFFERADLVKFAKHRPSVGVCRSLLESARTLVDVTRTPDVVETEGDTDPDTATAA